MWSPHAVEDYSAIKRDEELTHATIWTFPQSIMLNEEAGHKRPHMVGFYLCETSRTGKSMGMLSVLVVA